MRGLRRRFGETALEAFETAQIHAEKSGARTIEIGHKARHHGSHQGSYQRNQPESAALLIADNHTGQKPDQNKHDPHREGNAVFQCGNAAFAQCRHFIERIDEERKGWGRTLHGERFGLGPHLSLQGLVRSMAAASSPSAVEWLPMRE